MLGTSGWIQVPPRFHNADRIVLHRYGHDPETIDAAHPQGRVKHCRRVVGRAHSARSRYVVDGLVDLAFDG